MIRLHAERNSTRQWLPPWVAFQHEARYAFAAERVRGCRVIDIACGEGLAAGPMLAAGAVSVEGFDGSPEAVALARRRNPDPRARFAQADGLQLPVGDESYDACVSLETIEHIDDDRSFLREVRRVLQPGGLFICSTPNRRLTNPAASMNDRPYNPFHVREYVQEELDALLAVHFDEREWWGQCSWSPWYAEQLRRIGAVAPRLAVRCHQLRKTFGVPWDSLARHCPQPLNGDFEPEILVVVGRARP